MTSSVTHFIERKRTLFSGRVNVFVLKNEIQTVAFEEQSTDIGQISSITILVLEI